VEGEGGGGMSGGSLRGCQRYSVAVIQMVVGSVLGVNVKPFNRVQVGSFLVVM
jgi:hypothetical protein